MVTNEEASRLAAQVTTALQVAAELDAIGVVKNCTGTGESEDPNQVLQTRVEAFCARFAEKVEAE